MRPVFPKIAEIRRDRPGLISEKPPALFTEKLVLFTKKSVLFIKKLVQKSDLATSDFFQSVEFLNTAN
jgi:hypothetical protein